MTNRHDFPCSNRRAFHDTARGARRLGRVAMILTALLTLVALAATAVASGSSVEQTAVFVGGEGGYHTYRIPAIVRAPDGSVLAFCEGRKDSGADSGNIDLLLKRSRDGGRTWRAAQVLWDDGANTCGNPCAVVDRTTGAIWLLASHNLGPDREAAVTSRTAAGTRTVWVLHSEDNGAHWSEPTEITATTKDPAWGWYATGPGVGIQIETGAHAGRLVIPCDHSGVGPDGKLRRESHVIYSDDHGRTWRLGGTIRPQVNECQGAELFDGAGTLLMDLRSYAGHHCRAEATSTDGGETWTAAHDVPALPDPVCQASLIRVASARALLFANAADPRKRVRLTVRASTDDARTWPKSLVLQEGPAAYSCLVDLGEGDAGCLYECGEKNPYQRIMFARFPLTAVSAPTAPAP